MRQSIALLAGAVAALLALGSCAQKVPASTERPTDACATALGSARVIPRDKVTPDRVIVQFNPSINSQLLPQALHVAGFRLTMHGHGFEPATRVYQVTGATSTEVDKVLHELRARRDVVYAEADARLYPLTLREPTDERYAEQWSLTSINMPRAWGVTVGSTESVIAILDTGILFDAHDPSKRHPDLAGRVLPGYDFISKPAIANDGDNVRDDNAFDPGGDEVSCNNGTYTYSSSYHGTHVAGIAAAATNNGTPIGMGVAGVHWNAKILPVRVLGRGGGDMLDIADAIHWAAGGEVPGVPPNQTPASVINLSVGGDGPCPATLQNAIHSAVSRKVVVVAAAGNANVDASSTFPANCTGVITVGATNKNGNRSSYSNYGPAVTLMAPGGDRLGGILNIWGSDADPKFFVYAQIAGTSMAAPHVAAVAALIKEQNPGYTPADVRKRLVDTAKPLTNSQCGTLNGCGAGLLDAANAVGAP